MAENTLFAELVDLCVDLEGTTKKNEKSQLIESFLHQLKEEEISPSVLLILGTIFPAADPRSLNVSSATVGRVTKRIKDTENPQAEPLTILGVHNYFGEIASTSGKGSRKRIDDLLETLLRRGSSLEAEYIIKIIFGEMIIARNRIQRRSS